MAIIGKIRNQLGWLMILLVVLGVGGFLVMDVASGRYGGGGSGMVDEIGKVNGEPISTQKFYNLVDMYSDNQTERAELQNSVWNVLVSQALIEAETQKLGLGVTAKEMGELFLGADEDMSFTVRNYFGRQTGGQVDRTQLKNFIETYSNELDLSRYPQEQHEAILKQQKDFINLQEQVRWERLSQKYTALLRKAMYTPKWMVEQDYPREKREFEINYVLIPYTAVNAEVSDEELNAYIAENPKKFQREASVDVEFVAFKNYASAADSALYKGELDALVGELSSTASYLDLSDFVARNDGFMDSITYFKKDDLTREPQFIVDSLFAAPKGSVFGPYMHNGSYRLLKLLERETMADSVDCQHIMFVVQTQDDYNMGLQRLDSLKKAIEAGTANFDSLAMQFSFDDQTKANGGRIGYVGRDSRFGKNFEDNVFFLTKKDSMSIVASQVGQSVNLHLVRVLGQKLGKDQGVRIAAFQRNIMPSEETTRNNRSLAQDFLTKNRDLESFRAAAKSANLGVISAYGLPEFGFEISGLGKNKTAADIIRWAHFQAGKAGEVSGSIFGLENQELNYTEQLVLPVLVNRNAKGVGTLSNPEVKAEADRVVRGRKRVEAVKAATKGKNLTDVAAQYNVEVRTANFNYGVPLIGELRMQEHKVAAVADMLQPNAISEALGGKQGIFLVNLIKKTETPLLDMVVAGNVVGRRYVDVINNRLTDAMLEDAKLVDNRRLVINN